MLRFCGGGGSVFYPNALKRMYIYVYFYYLLKLIITDGSRNSSSEQLLQYETSSSNKINDTSISGPILMRKSSVIRLSMKKNSLDRDETSEFRKFNFLICSLKRFTFHIFMGSYMFLFLQVFQKNIFVVHKQDSRFHVVQKRNQPLDVGLLLTPRFSLFVMKTFSSITFNIFLLILNF